MSSGLTWKGTDMASCCFYKEDNGTWTARPRYKDREGKWRSPRKRGFRTKTDALWWWDHESGLNKSHYRPAPRTTVDELRERWLPTLADRSLGTQRAYAYWTGLFADRYGHEQVAALTLEDLERWLAELADNPDKSATTVRQAKKNVSVMLNDAVRWGIIATNPAALVKTRAPTPPSAGCGTSPRWAPSCPTPRATGWPSPTGCCC